MVKYNLAIPREAWQAQVYLKKLYENKNLVELKRVSPRRTLKQNAYLHLLIGAFGLHFGYTLDEAKQVYKQLNASVYRYKKKDLTFWRSSADLTKEEMAQTIDVLMRKSADHGYPLPLATDEGWLREIENRIEQEKYYLGG